MPFFPPVVHSEKHKKMKLGCDSLQVQKPKKYKEKIKKINVSQGKRVYLFTSKGSITLEAAIVITIFMLAILSVISYITVLNKQLHNQKQINNMGIALSKLNYYKQCTEKSKKYSEDLGLLESGVQSFKQSGEIEKKTSEEGVIDIVFPYIVRIPYINKPIVLTQRCYLKDWTGYDLTKEQELVYITKNGKVYHVTKECTHLSLKISKIGVIELKIKRNCYGQVYNRCSICVNKKGTLGSEVFITEDGNKYHNSLMCSGLLRNIITVEKSKVKNMPPCSRCSGK